MENDMVTVNLSLENVVKFDAFDRLKQKMEDFVDKPSFDELREDIDNMATK